MYEDEGGVVVNVNEPYFPDGTAGKNFIYLFFALFFFSTGPYLKNIIFFLFKNLYYYPN